MRRVEVTVLFVLDVVQVLCVLARMHERMGDRPVLEQHDRDREQQAGEHRTDVQDERPHTTLIGQLRPTHRPNETGEPSTARSADALNCWPATRHSGLPIDASMQAGVPRMRSRHAGRSVNHTSSA
jgi:hypothetical protein